jgi:hypothetical protein
MREKAAGRLDADIQEEQLADFCLATILGAMLLGKVKRRVELVEGVVRETMTHVRRYAVARTNEIGPDIDERRRAPLRSEA